MAETRVLVTYGSRNGGTATIAEWIADELQRGVLSVDLKDARSVESVDDYDAVVLGSAVYLRRWQRDARRLSRHQAHSLARRRVWLFSSGPVDPGTVVPNSDVPLRVRRLADRIGAHEHVTFGGRLEVDAPDWFARTLARRGMAGDFRDESAVRAWAAKISAALTQPGDPDGSATGHRD